MRLSKVIGSWGVASVILLVGMSGCGESTRSPGSAVGVAREAAFINGDFESDAVNVTPPTGWTISSFNNPSITDLRPSPQTLASLNLSTAVSSYLATHIVGGATESQADPDLGAGASLRFPKYGLRSAVVNYKDAANPGNLQNVNQLTQTMTTTNSDVDAADNKVHVRFAIAPVLYSGGHPYNQQPYYYVELDNLTKGTTLYRDFNASAQAGVPWKTDGANALIYYTDWSLVDIAPGNSGLAVGDQVKLIVIAGGCSAGGHFGRVYVDGIGSAIPGIYTSATGPASANAGSDVTYIVSYKNGGTTTAAATQLKIVIPQSQTPLAPVTATSVWPIGTTYRSNSLPSACSGVAVGGTGTLTCSLGDLAPGASGSFTVTLNINTTRSDGASATTGGAAVTNGNYSIQATGVTALLGPKVLTTVTSNVTYADVAVTKTDGVAAVGWGQPVTYAVVASNAGPGAASSVTVADTMPAQFSGATWTCAGAGGGTCSVASGTGNLSGSVSLPVGATATYTISGTIVAGTGTGSITNNATATLSGATDPDTTNNSGVDTDSIGVLRTLTVTKTNSNGGSVTSVPASIACGTSCGSASGSFVDGTSVVLSASPVSGASFTSWGGACSGSASTCTLTITSDVSVTAAFTPPPTVNLITGNNQGAALSTAFATTLTVRVLDSTGAPLSGRTVLFTVPPTGASASLSATSVTTDASGNTPAITATANGTAGAYSVVAALSGTPTTGTFSLWNYGVASTISVVVGTPQSATVATAFATPLTVIVRDAASQPVAGATVTFTAPGSGARATLSAGPFTTGASGQVSATATAGQTAGSYSVTATTGALTPATFALTNAAGAAASIAATSGGGQTTLVSTAFGSSLMVTVVDALGNPVPGAAVTFTVPGSGASVVLGTASGTTNASGQLSTTATANASMGAYSVSAAVSGVSAPVNFALSNYGTLVLSPATTTVAPRATVTFVASGDVPGTYVYSISTNGSGGSINGATGVYTAGATGGATDVVQVVDSHGRTATATVTVGPGVGITPASTTSAPRGSRAFAATGGSGTFTFALLANLSGGNINGATGAYTAGATGSVTDVVRVTDSLGNSATASVVVGVGVSLSPATTSVAPRGTRTFTATGGGGTFTYAVSTNASGGTINSSGVYTAGATGGVTDIVTATDSLGNSATASVAVGVGASLSPATSSVAPRGTRTFTATGGSGTFTYAMSTNASGGSINSSGVYTAGATGGVTDVVTATDSLGNSATASVAVGSGVSLSPATTSVAPRGTRTFTATGGSGTFTYAMLTNASGGSINSSGVYTAGATGGVTDVVKATDSLGNSATASVAVGVGASLSPATSSVAPRGTRTFTATGGSGTFTYAVSTNASGGSINSGGVYTAGATGGVTDIVTATDSLGNSATASVTVGTGVSLSPATTSVSPRGTRTFTATGGAGTFTYAVSTNASGGSINSSGVYTAGATGGVTDVVKATDSLGNSATASVTVGVGASLSPATSSVAPRGTRTFTATGGGGTFTYVVLTNASGGSIDSSGVYTAGATGGVTDVVKATDSLGNSATATVSVTGGITLSPATASTTPQGTVNFTASGGSGQGYVYASTAASGGAIDAAGKFVAGTSGNVSETVTVNDSLGNSATATVTVGPGVSVTPSSVTVAPRGTRTFTAAGGSGTGFTYALSTNASSGTIVAATGAYTAGATGSVTDVITATDSLGNKGTASIAVGAGIQLTPPAPSAPPQGTIGFTATGGSGSGYSYAVTTNHSSATIDATGSYVAGVTGNVGDVVTVTDTLGNTATASITVGPAVSLTASATSTPPRGTLTFSAVGGSGTPFVYSLGVNASGGSIDPTTGAYTAGSTSSVTDTVVVTDSLGNVAAVNIAVGTGVSISPASPAAPPRGQLNLVASGGSGLGYVYTIVASGSSGGSVDTTSGLYTAGALGSTVDVVRATDSLGNSATVAISVGNGLVVNPAAPSLAPRQSQLFSAAGGDSAAGASFALTTNASGGTINAATGAYVAGPLGTTTDVVTVTDMLGNTTTATVQVGPGLLITPPALSLAPLGTQTFAVSGGSGSSYRFSLTAAPSGGTIDPGTGAYACGTLGGVTDVVNVTDSLGNVASVPVTVTQGLVAVSSTLSISPLGSSTLAVTGGSGGYTFALTTNGSGSTLDASTGAYVAGSTGSTSDLVTVTDSNGATTTIRVNIGAGVSLAPANPSAPPRGLLRFTASGGSEGGYVYSLSSNPSGGTIDPATGAYQAGALSNTLDVVHVVDSLGNVATVSISIGGGLTINPATPSVAPQATVTFAAAGGSGTGFVFSLSHNMSGGAIVASTGVYRAGSTPNVADEVTVTDSLGNSVATTVTVGAGVLIAPASSQVAPGGTVALTASGGSGTGYVFALTSQPSGGTVDSATGVYVAGTTASVSDTVTVTDSLQNSATATIAVGAGISLSAPTLQTPPRGSLRLTAGGGSGIYTFALRSNGSHATIGATTGLYTAGATPDTTDQVAVTDDLGNSATLQITVGHGVSIAPASPIAAPGGGVTFTAVGGSGTGFLFTLTTSGSGGAIDSQSGAYTAGDTDDTEDVVTVVDSLGNTTSVSVAIGNHVSLNPPAVSVSPRAVVQFSASGGSGTGYHFTLVTNSSGATIDATSGAYQAGATANMTDVVRVVDSLGKSATATVTVGAGLSVTPATVTVAPAGTLGLAVSGGSGSGQRFTLSTNGSGGTVDAALGNYTAGSTGSTTDVITVTDSFGNIGTVTITVGGVLSVAMPAGGTLPPRATLQLVVTDGAVPYAFAVSTNRSGSTINGATGEYVAGPTPNVADVVTVTDANAVAKTVTINVGVGVSIAPLNSRVATGGTLQLSASGGSGTGFTWRLVDTSAGGSIDTTTGLYTASHTPGAGTSDVAEARDSLGNTATTTIQIQVSTGSTVSASGGSGCSCDTGASGPAGHLPAALIGLLLAAMAVARRRGPRSQDLRTAVRRMLRAQR